MKLAFVGKGGSGKSTISSLCIIGLIDAGHRVLAIDADLNAHSAELLGITDSPTPLSDNDRKKAIKNTLRGTNSAISTDDEMVKTTPPGRGSYIIRDLLTDPFLQTITTSVRATGRLAVTGTCTENDIGIHCYHKNLAITELLVSHIDEPSNDFVILDMVAGVDAFSHTLHAQVDALLFIVEPTPESVSVAHEYKRLAETAGRGKDVFFIANKIMDASDQEYLKKNQINPIAFFPYLATLKNLRQNGESLEKTELPEVVHFINTLILFLNKNITVDKTKRLERLWHLHEAYATRPSTLQKHGDILKQIDKNFYYET